MAPLPGARRHHRPPAPDRVAPRLPHVPRARERDLQPLLLPPATALRVGGRAAHGPRREARARARRGKNERAPARRRRVTVAATCPGCGAEITFRFDRAVVNVCRYCRTVVLRTDRGFEDLGKVSDLIESESPLDVGLSGQWQGVPFQLTGRAQMRHPAGGVWDEWYAAFADGRWGWLAEAQGKLYLTFETQAQGELPAFESLTPGTATDALLPGTRLVVAERATATMMGALGEIPYRLQPNAQFRYADLSGPSGVFATIDY